MQEDNQVTSFDDRFYINLPVTRYNNNSELDGFASRGHVGYLWQASAQIQLANAYRLAGGYQPWEVGYYTVPANFGKSSMFGTVSLR